MNAQHRWLYQMAARIPRGIEKKEGPDLELQIKTIKDEILARVGGNKEQLDGLLQKYTRLQSQVDAIDLRGADRHFADGGEKSIGQRVVEAQSFAEYKSGGFRARGGARILIDGSVFEQKTVTNTGLGSGTSGILNPTRIGGITDLAFQKLRIRDRMTVRPLDTGNSFDWVKQTGRSNAASPQTEAAAKGESSYVWESQLGTIKTLAHFIRVSRQALADNNWLQSTIDGELLYGLKLKEEAEILSGVGTGEHLSGIITQATAYDTGRNIAGDTYLDKLRHAKLQARLAGLATYEPDTFVLNPADMEKIELIKTEEGAANKGVYVVGDPKTGQQVKFLWDLPCIESDSITAGTFLVGAFGSGAILVDRMAANIDISYEDADNFTKNLATILCEERLGLAVLKPDSFIYGSF